MLTALLCCCKELQRRPHDRPVRSQEAWEEQAPSSSRSQTSDRGKFLDGGICGDGHRLLCHCRHHCLFAVCRHIRVISDSALRNAHLATRHKFRSVASSHCELGPNHCHQDADRWCRTQRPGGGRRRSCATTRDLSKIFICRASNVVLESQILNANTIAQPCSGADGEKKIIRSIRTIVD